MTNAEGKDKNGKMPKRRNTADALHLSISLANLGLTLLPQLDIQDAIAVAKEAEQQGFESLWTSETPFMRNGFVMASAYALSTSRARVGTDIVNVYTRNPVLLASSALTLDNLSGGRFILGLGTSHNATMEAVGAQIQKPLARIRETVEVVRRAIRGERFSFDGEFYKLKNVEMNLRPLKGDIPIFLAAVGKKMIQLSSEVADGVLLIHNTPSYAKNAVNEIEIGAKKAGRNPKKIEVACWLTTCISKDPSSAITAVKNVVAMTGRMPFYHNLFKLSGFEKEGDLIMNAWKEGRGKDAPTYVTDEMAKNLTVSGTAEECRARIDEYAKAGVNVPVLAPYPVDGDAKRAFHDVIRAFSR